MAVKVRQHKDNDNRDEMSFTMKNFRDMMAVIGKTEDQLDLGEISAKETADRMREMRQYLEAAPLLPEIKKMLRTAVDILNLKLKWHRFEKKNQGKKEAKE